MSKTIFLSIGTNKGDKISNCKLVTKKIKLISDVINISSIYKTESWGFSADFFLNFVIEIKTNLSPHNLLDGLLKIENEMGRFRTKNIKKKQYDSRVIDIDILFFGNEIIRSKELIIPHPKLNYRSFTLIPLCELKPYFVCPISNKTIEDILKNCKDTSFVKKITETINL
tara:strand:+ start:51 stop:560 length:510 start_codon:yes stop_codon:yes gene_type:complete